MADMYIYICMYLSYSYICPTGATELLTNQLFFPLLLSCTDLLLTGSRSVLELSWSSSSFTSDSEHEALFNS